MNLQSGPIMGWERGSIHELKVNGAAIISDPDNDYMFMKYRFSWTGELVVCFVDGPAFADAVKKGKLPGNTDSGQTTIVHAPPGRLLEFIETSKPADVFQQEGAFTNIGK